jgi:hypothetical protein
MPPSSAFDSEAQALKGVPLGIATKGIVSLDFSVAFVLDAVRRTSNGPVRFNVKFCTLF